MINVKTNEVPRSCPRVIKVHGLRQQQNNFVRQIKSWLKVIKLTDDYSEQAGLNFKK